MTFTELDRANSWASSNRDVLREAGKHWVATGEWLTVTELGRSALRRDETRDVFAALRDLPPSLGQVQRPSDEVVLRIRGLVVTAEAQGLLHEFVRVLWLAMTKLRSEEPDPTVSAPDLESLGHDDLTAQRVSQLVINEDWMFGGGSGAPDGGWSRAVDEHTRAVATVRSVDDYLAVEGERFWNKPAAVLRSGAALGSPVSWSGSLDAGQGLSEPSEDPKTPTLSVHDLPPRISREAGALVADGHYHAAVHAGAIALRDVLREASARHDLDGDALAGAAFGGPNPPVRIADVAASDGRREQEGWRMLAQGCVAALRNPAAHRRTDDDLLSAMHALATMSMIARKIDNAPAEPKGRPTPAS